MCLSQIKPARANKKQKYEIEIKQYQVAIVIIAISHHISYLNVTKNGKYK